MGFLTRFTNPIWYEFEKLPKHQQILAATVITIYGYLREMVKENLIKAFLPNTKTSVYNKPVDAYQQALMTKKIDFLVDEAVIGILRSCNCPIEDPNEKLSDYFPSYIPEILGIIALADSNKRWKRTTPIILDNTDYSTDPSEARDLVLLRWQDILRIDDSLFLDNKKMTGFSKAWAEIVDSFFYGTLIGLGRLGNDEIIKRAHQNTKDMPSHLTPILNYIISLIKRNDFSVEFKRSNKGLVKGTHGETIKVLIVDDRMGNRENLKELLRDAQDIHIVGESDNGVDAIDQFVNLKPDIVLMDTDMPELDGISATREICKRSPNACVVICTIQSSSFFMRQAVLAGARDYLTFPIFPSELKEVIRRGNSRETELKRPVQDENMVELEKNLNSAGILVLQFMKDSLELRGGSPEKMWQVNHFTYQTRLNFNVLLNGNYSDGFGGNIDFTAYIAHITSIIFTNFVHFNFSETWLTIRVKTEGKESVEIDWLVSCKIKDLLDAVEEKGGNEESEVYSRIMNIMYIWEK